MSTLHDDKRLHPRAKVNWPVEYTAVSRSRALLHEGTKLSDYSQTGACFLSMCELEIGMKLDMHITLPVRMARTLLLHGVVVRVDDRYDVGRMFRAVAVRWIPGPRRSLSSVQRGQQQPAYATMSH